MVLKSIQRVFTSGFYEIYMLSVAYILRVKNSVKSLCWTEFVCHKLSGSLNQIKYSPAARVYRIFLIGFALNKNGITVYNSYPVI